MYADMFVRTECMERQLGVVVVAGGVKESQTNLKMDGQGRKVSRHAAGIPHPKRPARVLGSARGVQHPHTTVDHVARVAHALPRMRQALGLPHAQAQPARGGRVRLRGGLVTDSPRPGCRGAVAVGTGNGGRGRWGKTGAWGLCLELVICQDAAGGVARPDLVE